MSTKVPKYIVLALAIALSGCARFSHKKETLPSESGTSILPKAAQGATALTGSDEAALPNQNIVRLGSNVNTTWSDFAPFRYADRLYFSSESIGKNGKPTVNKVFSSFKSNPSTSWPENSKESNVHTSNMVFSADGQRVYYTFCEVDTKSGEQTCEIYTRERNYEGDWQAFKRLPRSINLDGYTTTQPAVGYDHRLKKEVLYFASNRPGGKGGMDIWCSTIEKDNNYGTPFSLSLNSPQDDVTPFFYQAGQTLFFSSNRSSAASSGLDVYKATSTGRNIWTAAQRLEAPFNSPSDDLYFSYHSPSGKAYFASNRPGCIGLDSLHNCVGFDIFEAGVPTMLNLQVLDLANNANLYGTKISVTDVDSKTPLTATNAAENQQKYAVKPGRQYTLVVKADGYMTDSTTIEIKAADIFSTIEKTVYLRTKTKFIVQVFNAIDSLPLNGVSYQLQTESAKLAGVVEKSNEQIFALGLGEKAKLEVKKPGFNAAVLNIEAASGGPAVAIYQRVYLKPFSSLPLAFFFDNDQPRWVTPMDTETKLAYDETLQQYIARKQVFVEKYGEGLQGEALETAQQEVLDFFEQEVEPSVGQLDQLCTEIETYLKNGHRLEIITESEASPLATSDYNQRLASRRASSLRNYLKTWRYGALKTYLYSGKLVVSSDFKQTGTSEAAGTSILPDRRQTEYSPEASRKRRIVIKDVRLQVSKV